MFNAQIRPYITAQRLRFLNSEINANTTNPDWCFGHQYKVYSFIVLFREFLTIKSIAVILGTSERMIYRILQNPEYGETAKAGRLYYLVVFIGLATDYKDFKNSCLSMGIYVRGDFNL